jgi:hypothetical protein
VPADVVTKTYFEEQASVVRFQILTAASVMIRVVTCGLFYDAVSDYIESNGGMIVNNFELKRSWLNRGHYPGICLAGLRKTTRHFSQDIQCPGQGSNRAYPEYKSRAYSLDAV